MVEGGEQRCAQVIAAVVKLFEFSSAKAVFVTTQTETMKVSAR
jgi:hypothetical protein